MQYERSTWFVVWVIAATQIFIAVFAVYSSNRDILSDGACLGGIFGTFGNAVLLAGLVLWSLGLCIRHAGKGDIANRLAPFLLLILTSGIAIAIGSQAGLRCTV